MDLSIIIPVFNVECYLKECLDSVYEISGISKEIIIVNDGSTDGSQKIIDKFKEKYPKETKVIVQKNKGLSGARNAGLAQARGEYISFIDSDDYIDAKKYSILFEEGKKLGLDIIFGDLRYYSGETSYMYESMIARMNKLEKLDICNGVEFWENSFDKNNDSIRVEVVTNIFRRQILYKNKLVFEEGLLHEDTLFMFIVTYYAKKVKYIPVDFYFYRVREGSIMNTINYKNHMHKMYIAKELQRFKENNYIQLLSWDSMMISLYFGALRKYHIKNIELYKRIKSGKKLTKLAKVKKAIIPFYHIISRETNITI